MKFMLRLEPYYDMGATPPTPIEIESLEDLLELVKDKTPPHGLITALLIMQPHYNDSGEWEIVEFSPYR